jgi:hypothetical protein
MSRKTDGLPRLLVQMNERPASIDTTLTLLAKDFREFAGATDLS